MAHRRLPVVVALALLAAPPVAAASVADGSAGDGEGPSTGQTTPTDPPTVTTPTAPAPPTTTTPPSTAPTPPPAPVPVPPAEVPAPPAAPPTTTDATPPASAPDGDPDVIDTTRGDRDRRSDRVPLRDGKRRRADRDRRARKGDKAKRAKGKKDAKDADAQDALAASGADVLGAPLKGLSALSVSAFRIPPFLLPVYQAAGVQYGIRWEVLAAINEIETDFGRNLSVSTAGALGWMQFMPATWLQYGVDATGDDEKDPYNPVDAIFAAARYLKAAGGDKDIAKAVFAYNHAQWYVDDVMKRARAIAALPSDVVSSLAGLTLAQLPVYVPADASDAAADRDDAGDDAADEADAAEKGGDADKDDAAEKRDDADEADADQQHEDAGSDVVVGDGGAKEWATVRAPADAPAVAVQDGTVTRMGESAHLGRFVEIRDAYGNRYTYAGLGSLATSHLVPRRQSCAKDCAKDHDHEHEQDDARPRAAATVTPARAAEDAAAKRKAADAPSAPKASADPRAAPTASSPGMGPARPVVIGGADGPTTPQHEAPRGEDPDLRGPVPTAPTPPPAPPTVTVPNAPTTTEPAPPTTTAPTTTGPDATTTATAPAAPPTATAPTPKPPTATGPTTAPPTVTLPTPLTGPTPTVPTPTVTTPTDTTPTDTTPTDTTTTPTVTAPTGTTPTDTGPTGTAPTTTPTAPVPTADPPIAVPPAPPVDLLHPTADRIDAVAALRWQGVPAAPTPAPSEPKTSADADVDESVDEIGRYMVRAGALRRSDVRLRRMRVGSKVMAGTILGRLDVTGAGDAAERKSAATDGDATAAERKSAAAAGDATAERKVASTDGDATAAGDNDTRSSMRFAIRPAGDGAPRIDPRPIVDGWRLLDDTEVFGNGDASPLVADRGERPDVGRLLLMGKEQLQARVLANPRLTIYPAGQADIRTGAIDRRVLATMEFLAANGMELSISSLKSGHSIMSASGNVSAHSYGAAMDIASVNGISIMGHQGAGSITDRTIRKLLELQGTMRPNQIISLMTYPGTDNTLSMADHADHIHVGFPRAAGEGTVTLGRQVAAVLQPGQWNQLMDRLARIDNPKVRRGVSEAALPAKVAKDAGAKDGAGAKGKPAASRRRSR